MKIIQLIQKPQLRGAEIFASQLSNHLAEKGNQVLLIAIFEGDSELPVTVPFLYFGRPIRKRFYDFKAWKKFSEVVGEFKPDIIQANAADTLKFAISSKLLFSWKVPVVFRNANKMGDFINSGVKWRINNFYLSKVASVISVSDECRKDFIETFRFPEEKVVTIQIGVEKKNIGRIPSDLEFVFEKGPVISHVGSFVPEKNHFGVLRIFKSLVQRHQNVQLLLIGKGHMEEKVKREVKDLKLQDKVHFIGYRNDVLEILEASAVFVLPSFIEGLPGVILEAMFCGTPVVAFQVGGIGEIVRSESTGWLIEKSDEEGFIDAVDQVLNNDSVVQQKIDNSKSLVHQKFMNTAISERFLTQYSKVLKQRNL